LALLALVYAAAMPRAIEPGAAITSTLGAFAALAFALLLVRALPGGRGATLPLGAIVAAAVRLDPLSTTCKRESLYFYLTLYQCQPGDELGAKVVAASAMAEELASLPDVVERRRAEALGRLGEGPRSSAQIRVTPRLALEAAKARYFFRDWNGAQTLLDVAKKAVALTLEWGRWSYLVAEAMVQAGVPGAEAGLARLRGLPHLRFIQEQSEYQLVKGPPSS